jgi:hypothetical protein
MGFLNLSLVKIGIENTSDHAVGVGEERISYSGLSYDLLPRQYHLPQTIPFLDIANFPVT